MILVALAGLAAVSWYTNAGGEVRWAFSSAAPPAVGESQVVPATFLQPVGKERDKLVSTSSLELRVRDSATGGIKSGKDALALNGDHDESGFQIALKDFLAGHPSAKGGRLELRSGSLPLRLHDVPTGDYVLLPDETPVNAFAIKLPLAELKDQGEKDVIAYWTPQDDKAGDLDALSYRSNPIKVKIDTVGPVLRQVRLSGDLKQGPEVILEFESSDFDPATVKAKNFSVQRALEDGRFEVEREIADATIDKTDPKVIRLKFAVLDPGVYRVRVLGTKASGTADPQVPLRDSVGNHAGGSGTRGLNQERIFGASPAPEPGKQVEFAEFQPTLPQPQFARRINPADKVVTEVVRLYYYRDAHRVAQLINRTAESLNRAAVDLARRRAEDARVSADDATDQRRSSEREAVRRVEELRRAEHEAAQARQDLTAAQQDQQRLQDHQAALQRQIEEFQARFPNFQADYSAAAAADRQAELNLWQANDALANQQQKIRTKFDELQSLQAALTQQPADPRAPAWQQQLAGAQTELARLQADEATLTNDRDAQQAARNLAAQRLEPLAAQKALIDKLTGDKSAMDAATASASAQASGQRQLVVNKEGVLANLRSTAAMANETAITAQAKEDRAREQQFRLEVSAAHEDPDTYAPAKLDSVDPVAQVSVQVIGEGLIQLRGPQKGVNKIKTAINQIDAPVGQVKVEVVTVQLNGERGNRMEAPLGRVEAHLGMGRFLTAQSLMLLRQAIQEEATRIAQEQEQGGRYQIDRDRKYLYGFFGQDFIDELYEMDSEFLHTENKLLSLHSMDTISLHQALFIMALAKNDVRQMILANFMAKVRAELVQAEFDYRCSSELAPFKTRTFFFPSDPRCKKQTHWYQVVAENNRLRYNFRNLQTFYATLDTSAGDAMNPVQREFIRLAQIFKARLVTELELKQRVIERAMIEDDRERNLLEEEQAEASIRPQVLDLTREVRQQEFKASDQLVASLQAAQELFANVELQVKYADAVLETVVRQQTIAAIGEIIQKGPNVDTGALESTLANATGGLERILELKPLTAAARSAYRQMLDQLQQPRKSLQEKHDETSLKDLQRAVVDGTMSERFQKVRQTQLDTLRAIRSSFQAFAQTADIRRFDWEATVRAYRELDELLAGCEQDAVAELRESALAAYDQASALHLAKSRAGNARSYLQQTRSSLDRRKLLDFLIEEQEYKYIDLLEGVRAQIASMDNHLKRLSIALEDDFKLQFYDPAFVRIRDAAREWEVTLGQVERTSILTNNRAFAKVMPQATMEFDLPKRKIAVAEAFDSAKALVDDYGALLNDPTFLAAYQIMGGKASNGKVQNVLPGLPSQTDEQQMGFSSPFAGPPGSSLQALVPDPSVYKFETGTGFEIRPVIQPDGNSIVYDFNYMYTTEIREPVRADEKHLGRIKRHFINTQVQTSSFELREISRYQVALKAARTSQGVPLLQDIPIAGLAFRPLPSAESSIQQNVILGSSVVYPTLFDLMGLRWAPSVVDLDHISVRDAEHVVRGRRWSIESSVFQQSSEYVDRLLGLEYDTPQQYRPDLYHRHWEPSPYHPGGHTFPGRRPDDDPTGQGYEQPDRRPQEFREPPYDRRFRRPTMYETIPDQGPRFDSGTVPAPIPELRLPDGPSAADSMSLPSPDGSLPALGRP